MIPEFQTLDDSEIELVLKAPILVCILIAGADGTIDRKEIKEAISVTQKQKKSQSILSHYFREIAEDFEDKIKILSQSYPYESTQRNPIIIDELARLNPLWKRLDKNFSIALYEMLITLAEKVASSSGGLLGIKTVGTEEAKYLNLPMVQDPAKI
jgi:hypothetical protein